MKKISLMGVLVVLVLLPSIMTTSAQYNYVYATDQTEFHYKVVDDSGDFFSSVFNQDDEFTFELSASIKGNQVFSYDADLKIYRNGDEVDGLFEYITYELYFDLYLLIAVDGGATNFFEDSPISYEISGNTAIQSYDGFNTTKTFTYEKDTGILISWYEEGLNGEGNFELVQSEGFGTGFLDFNFYLILPFLLIAGVVRTIKFRKSSI